MNNSYEFFDEIFRIVSTIDIQDSISNIGSSLNNEDIFSFKPKVIYNSFNIITKKKSFTFDDNNNIFSVKYKECYSLFLSLKNSNLLGNIDVNYDIHLKHRIKLYDICIRITYTKGSKISIVFKNHKNETINTLWIEPLITEEEFNNQFFIIMLSTPEISTRLGSRFKISYDFLKKIQTLYYDLNNSSKNKNNSDLFIQEVIFVDANVSHKEETLIQDQCLDILKQIT